MESVTVFEVKFYLQNWWQIGFNLKTVVLLALDLKQQNNYFAYKCVIWIDFGRAALCSSEHALEKFEG